MDTFIIIVTNMFSTIFNIGFMQKMGWVVVPAIVAYGIYRFKKSELLQDGLYYYWGGGSRANPTKRGYITGQMWTTVDKLRGISFKNKNEHKNCIKFDNFKFFPDYIEKTKMPKFKSKSAESLEMNYPALSTAESVLFIGSAGSGKTIWHRSIIDQPWYTKLIIFSKKADAEIYFFRPGIDFMLSPKIEDGAIHDILSEDIQYIGLYINTLMSAAIGEKKDYFSGSAMQRLQTMAERVKIKSVDNISTTREKWVMFIDFIEGAIDESMTAEQKSEGDVMNTVKTVLELLYLVAYRVANGATTFTAKNFFNSDIYGQKLFLTGTDKSLEAILSASLAVLIKYQISMKDIVEWNPDYLVMYSMDEYLSLDKVIDSEILDEMTQVGRSKGISSWKGIQRITAKDKEKTQALISSVHYIVVFSTVDPDTIKIIQSIASEIEYRYEDISTSKTAGRVTENKSIKITKRQVLDDHPIKILQLHDYAHITYLPKKDLLYMGSSSFVERKKREYINFAEIDMTEFARWKIARIDRNKAFEDAKKSLISEKTIEKIKTRIR